MQPGKSGLEETGAAEVHTAPCRSCGCGGGGSARRAQEEERVGVGGVGGGGGGDDGEVLHASHSSIHPGSNEQVDFNL
ncbi:unnamed protein product [Pleuronectes platessa]|uniref:Uncharacterized protein n=1 Tax=Pleuronectes platessa TaxID=8262 RepID=A0A9N7TT05_PLEPL|nr:unnamed protein product [Pleuronectes platessa]